ncbi:hypothetical protein D3C76_943560 [compost metagenome]
MVACSRSRGPVDQGLLFELLELFLQPQGLDRHTHGAFAQQGGRAGVHAVEPQAAGRRIRTVAPGIAGEHGVQRADGQGIGATLGGAAGQLLQRQAVAETAITGTAQAVELGADAPAAGCRGVQGILQAEAACRGDGEGEVPVADLYAVITDR